MGIFFFMLVLKLKALMKFPLTVNQREFNLKVIILKEVIIIILVPVLSTKNNNKTPNKMCHLIENESYSCNCGSMSLYVRGWLEQDPDAGYNRPENNQWFY